jgi:hypothetical protein
MRRIAAMERVSQNTGVQMLHEQLLYPYHLEWVQNLTPADYPGRAAFSQWLLTKCATNPHFLSDCLFTDEAGFS